MAEAKRDLFAVDQRTHQDWRARLVVVDRLADWVCSNLDWEKREKHENPKERRRKAYQYVHEHFIVGQMKQPFEREDPLFTRAHYEDPSMENMLRSGMYPLFKARMHRELEWFDQEIVSCENGARLTLIDVTAGVPPHTRKILQGLEAELRQRHKEQDEKWYEDQLVGLVVRYRCMGVFSDNLHGSFPKSWAEHFPDCVECFASPFNHKYETYFSMFEADRVFGSNGCFFVYLAEREDMLPAGRYEINPPYINEVYDRIQQILRKSMAGSDAIQAIVGAPNWADADWYTEGFPSLLKIAGYSKRSFHTVIDIEYVNDAMGQRWNQPTAIWVYTTRAIPKSILQKLHILPRQARSKQPEQHQK